MNIALNESFPLKGADYTTTQTVDGLPRHRWYLIKEGFSPKLVEAAIDTMGLKGNEVVVDPFSGCGTVALTAAQRGLNAFGFEVNPFLAFVSRTKAGSCSTKELSLSSHYLLDAILNPRARRSPLEGLSTFSPRNGITKWLFNTEVLRAFEAGWLAVEARPRPIQPYVRLALLKAAMDNCNAKADGKCLRYRRDWEEKKFDRFSFGIAFEGHLGSIKNDIEIANVPGSATIRVGDARCLLPRHPQSFRLCVTSPPYLNSFDYSDVYRPELFLAKFVRDNNELRRIRLRTIRSHVQARWDSPTRSDFGEVYKAAVSSLIAAQANLWDKRIPLMVQAYFEDMATVLAALYKSAAQDAQAWLVVSTSAYGGVEIPVDMILAQIAEQCGWYLREIGVIRYLRHSGHHWRNLSASDRRKAKLRESVVMLSKSAP